MIADYTVKINGKWYRVGDVIPDFIPKNEQEQEKQYTKTDIYKMSTSELQKVGLQRGIKNADKLTGTELKKLLLADFDD